MQNKQNWDSLELQNLIWNKNWQKYENENPENAYSICEKVNASITSILQRQKYSCYHYDTYKMTLKEILSDKKTSFDSLVALEANILACLHNMHAIHDTLGHVIKYAFEFEFKDESKIYLKNIKNRLMKNEKYKKLVNLLNELMVHDDFIYLDAIVNYSKHRSIIQPNYAIDFVEDWSGMKFKAFIYKENEYETKKVEDFIITEYRRESRLIVSIGQIVNRLVTQENSIGA